jgi:type II secretory pathway pseudopilin PulG
MHSDKHNKGATLIEMLAAVIILSIVLIGVVQFIFVSRLNIYTANVRSGVMQTLKDTIIEYQYISPGIATNIPVTEPNILAYMPPDHPYITISKNLVATNGTYTINGAITWKAFPNGDGGAYLFTENLSLEIPQ